MLRQICVYCGSSAGSRPVYREAAHRTGELLARRKIGLVYGGGDVGLMGVVADACLAAGGEVIGVMPQALVEREIAHQGLTRLHIVRSMHERKALMADLSDGFLALPGAWGTLDELCEALTWAQLRIHGKPCGLLNVEGYFDGLLAFADHAVREGFLKPVHRGLLLSGTDPEALIATLLTARVPAADKWIER
ncbi:MAG: TIGR00730 family Rossman fold protein [Bryobacterales bacterium]|nr:TIGR00730 family Rossman fold protein [Bryobacterales bacterium]